MHHGCDFGWLTHSFHTTIVHYLRFVSVSYQFENNHQFHAKNGVSLPVYYTFFYCPHACAHALLLLVRSDRRVNCILKQQQQRQTTVSCGALEIPIRWRNSVCISINWQRWIKRAYATPKIKVKPRLSHRRMSWLGSFRTHFLHVYETWTLHEQFALSRGSTSDLVEKINIK